MSTCSQMASAAMLVAIMLSGGSALAQQAAPAETPGQPQTTQPWAETEASRNQRRQELEAVEADLAARAARREALRAEIEGLNADRAQLNSILIETTQRIGAAEDRVSAIEQRLTTLDGSEQAIRRSLESRRDVIAEVLAALQRMGRHPPPAVLVEPEDVLQAVRSSILLGAVVPELRAEAEALASDLAELARLRKQIAIDREALNKDITTLHGEQDRLSALIEERQRRIAEVEKTDAVEQAQVADLASKSDNLKDLISSMEQDIASARRAADEAEAASRQRDKAVDDRLAAAPFGDPARLEPKVSFAKAQGLLPFPVRGDIVRGFGASDGFGGTTQGISVVARDEAVIASPTDGWVVYSGPFRSFGQLLIINAGEGYYILLAGMERINVTLGQFVLAGEPVAIMGKGVSSGTSAYAANGLVGGGLAGGATGPILYIEFRKDGGSIDPAPWWAKAKSEKVRG
ncbi:murein hydrolase activator EnvC family protein [Pseudochelatococcus sp. G4_1912]|uniref:murein hydrolase activator EnvC family protein n=1 Tax=Pseudochelatococcus sp. G4_1912 TaxID=3114288 RepID=UPI0039C698F2